jgi:hypothetical protein
MNPTEPLDTGGAAATPGMSLPARLLNIFAEPGDVLEEVKVKPNSTGNWLVPALIFSVVIIASFLVIFSQPAIIQQIREQQAKELDRKVEAGSMTRTEADNRLAGFDKMGPTVMKIFLSIVGTITSFVRIFWWAFILWLLSRFALRTPLSYLKLLEVVGLATMIVTLGAIIGCLMTIYRGQLSWTSPALLISQFDPKNKSHALIGMWNPFTMWFVGVLAAGVAKLSGKSFGLALLVVGAYWVLWSLGLIALGLGEQAM